MPQLLDRLHEPAPTPPRGAGRLRAGRRPPLRRGGGGPRADLLREPPPCAEVRALGPPARRRLPHRHVPRARRTRRLRGDGHRAVALGRRAGARAAARNDPSRRDRGCRAARRRVRRDHDVGCDRAPARSGLDRARDLLDAQAGRDLRGHDDGRRRALPAARRQALAVVYADAPRLLLEAHARRAAASPGLRDRRDDPAQADRADQLPRLAHRHLQLPRRAHRRDAHTTGRAAHGGRRSRRHHHRDRAQARFLTHR